MLLLQSKNATTEDIEILGVLCDEIETLIHAGQDFMQKDMDFHARLAICSRNMVMSNLIPVICQGITVFSTMAEQEFEQTIKSHRKIFEAVSKRRAADAQQAMMFHLLYNSNRLIKKKKE